MRVDGGLTAVGKDTSGEWTRDTSVRVSQLEFTIFTGGSGLWVGECQSRRTSSSDSGLVDMGSGNGW